MEGGQLFGSFTEGASLFAAAAPPGSARQGRPVASGASRSSSTPAAAPPNPAGKPELKLVFVDAPARPSHTSTRVAAARAEPAVLPSMQSSPQGVDAGLAPSLVAAPILEPCSAPASPKGKGKAKGKGVPPGKAPPPKAAVPRPPPSDGPPGIVRPGKAPAPPPRGKAAAATRPLPIGRRLTIRGVAGGTTAEAFGGGESATPAGFDPDAVDLHALRNAFTPITKQTPRKNSQGSKEPRIEILPRDSAQNAAIVMRKLGIDTVGLAASLEQLSPGACKLTPDAVERLAHVVPSQELMQKVASFTGDPSTLRDIEQKLLPLSRVTRLAQRLRLLVLLLTLDARLGDAISQMVSLQSACSAVRGSSVLRDLLQVVVVLFNYINFGREPWETQKASGASTLRTVDVHSLMRLKETQAYGGPFPRYHMLHFVLTQLLQQRPELTRADLDLELGILPSVTSINIRQLERSLQQLRDDHAFVHKELRDHVQDYAPEGAADEERSRKPEASPRLTGKDHSDDESDEEDWEGLGGEDSLTPMKQRRVLLRRLLSQNIEPWQLAEDWRAGDEHGENAAQAEDGLPPPPGMLWRLRASGAWQQCWCEVRASLLVLYKIDVQRFLGTSYISLPAAEIFDANSGAPEVSRLSSTKLPFSFEVRPSGGFQAEVLRAESQIEATRWIAFLEGQARRCGVGHLLLNMGGRRLLGASWRRYFCVLERPGQRVGLSSRATCGSSASSLSEPRLLAFARPADCADGLAPERAWQLSNARATELSAEKSSDVARHIASVCPVGFELEDCESGRCCQFQCDSAAEQTSWLQTISGIPSSECRSRAISCVDNESVPDSDEDEDDQAPDRHSSLLNARPARVSAPSRMDAHSRRLPDLEEFFDQERRRRARRCSAPAQFTTDVIGPGEVTVPAARHRRKMSIPAIPQLQLWKLASALSEACGISMESEDHFVHDNGGIADLVTTSPDDFFTDRSEDGTLSRAESSDFPSPDCTGRVCALGQLELLEEELQAAVDHWSRQLAATEAATRRLVRFFGLPGRPPSSMLEALAAFRGQVNEAWKELEDHGVLAQLNARAPAASSDDEELSGTGGPASVSPKAEGSASVSPKRAITSPDAPRRSSSIRSTASAHHSDVASPGPHLC